ncbi:MAG: GNAT family N-acetyltransferase [Deltaproteobacteria bacterium]|nr:GNAT family N-acetyltransferase [Deltaproteobacteria bacterium]
MSDRYIIPTELESERLYFRMFCEEDFLSLLDFFQDEKSVEYVGGKILNEREVWRHKLCLYLGHWRIRKYGPYAIVEKNTGDLLGPVGLWYPNDWPEPEMKWAIRRKFWCKGYATEAATTIMDMVKKELGWQRLISLILNDNQRSVALAKRLGGIFEEEITFNGLTASIFVYDLKSKSIRGSLSES